MQDRETRSTVRRIGQTYRINISIDHIQICQVTNALAVLAVQGALVMVAKGHAALDAVLL